MPNIYVLSIYRINSIARMIARTHSATLLGVNAVEVEIECHEAPANNSFRLTIVGLPDASVKESRDRVMAAVMSDPRLKMDPASMPFDGKRMFWGGFNVLLAM